MADQELSLRNITTDSDGGYLHIILPSAAPTGFTSYRILATNLKFALSNFKERFAGKSADFTKVLDADTKLTRIDLLFVTGTPVIKVGTTPAGNDIISGRTLSTVKNSLNSLVDYFKTSKTLYFTITGGTADIILTYIKEWNT